MIEFKEKIINDKKLFKLAKESFYICLKNMQSDAELYSENFSDLLPEDIYCELAQISYYKNYEIDDLHYFDQVTEFNLKVSLLGYVLDEDNDKNLICQYALIFDENLNIIDDRLV